MVKGVVFSFPMFMTAIVLLFVIYRSTSVHFSRDTNPPLFYVPGQLLFESIIICALGWLLPNVTWIVPPYVDILTLAVGIQKVGAVKMNMIGLGITYAMFGLPLSIISWFISQAWRRANPDTVGARIAAAQAEKIIRESTQSAMSLREADARAREAEANAAVAEADARARLAEANARIAEADARKAGAMAGANKTESVADAADSAR